ncbi:ATP-dependent DNA helicase DinG [Vulcanibacillus modesticaldus]|uniref:ATP-dependent DNA helicase DinG n=1 Tax=Vulcanibacillus modesticaldus TaxID=337097 RepID=UPI000A403BFA|nr:ATP-dependent DNA helicase DinG [Vulcanibacillus modesticaldus]
MNRYIVVDLETTGNRPDIDKIIQVGAVLIEDHEIKDVFSSFVYTDREIPPFLQELTGITPEKLKDAPTIEEVMLKLLPMLEGSIFVAHNAVFDIAFIQNTLEDLGYMPFSGLIIDTLQLSRILLPMAQSYKLELIADELEISLDRPHRADEDSMATAKLLLQLLAQLNEMPLVYLQRLHQLAQSNNQDLSFIIEDIIAKKLNNYQENDDRFMIINQLALLMTEEEYQENQEYEFDQIQFESMFDENGLLFNNFPNFELRPAQKGMSNEVWNAFLDQTHLMVEAGTGTGKSLAYLIPSVFWTKQQNEKIVIATHTINLQEQLFQRDIPLLKKILPFDFSATILKGRSNYLCLRKFEQHLMQVNQINLSIDGMTDLGQVLTWVTLTKTGDVEEINLSQTGRSLWNEISSDPDSCLNHMCPWFRSCFYHRARQRAQTADLIITNHSLLLTNLKADNRILPGFNYLVIDEAHQFEEVATKHLGFELNQYQFSYFIQKYYKDGKTGFLVKAMNDFYQSQDPDQFVIANKIKNNVIPLISKVESNIQDYFNLLGEFVDQFVKNQDSNRKTLRIVERVKQRKEWEKIQEQAENIIIDLTEWANLMEDIIQQLRNLEVEESLLVDFTGYLKEIREVSLTFSEWNHANDLNMVFWVETVIKRKKIFSYLFAAPIEVGSFVKEFLFDKLDSVILTSATLSVNGSFNYASNWFGFDSKDEELRKIKLPSPFNYKEQALVCIPKDIPNIQEVSEERYIEHLAKNIADIAISLNGRTLVLFTSHQMLQKTYDLLKIILEPYQIKVLGHGIDSNSRSKLTKRFISDKQTILLGTNSFWEGVDVPGESLSALVIVRLPFTPPNHPIHEAKTERLRAKRKNPFMELSVPQAVVRFKQGFGRLIRTQKDKGVVIVFDKRIVESRYGKAFINSLPDVDIKYQQFTKLLQNINDWIN